MRKLWIIVVGVVLIVIIAVLSLVLGRGNQQPGEVTIKIWSPFDEREAYSQLLGTYLANHPQVKIDFQYISAADAKDYEAKVVNAIAAGTGPDIWLIRSDWLPKHQTKLTPAPKNIQWGDSAKGDQIEALKAKVSGAIVEQNSRDGQLYGLPVAVDSLALYINRAVVRAAQSDLSDANNSQADTLSTNPTTWAGVEQWSRLITESTRGTVTRSGLSAGNLENTYAPIDFYLALLTQKGGRLYSSDEKTVALHLAKSGTETYPAQDALSFFTSFAETGNPNYTWPATAGDPTQAFVAGKLGMMVGYSTLAMDIRRINKDFDQAVIIPLPQDKDLIEPSDKRVDYAAYWTQVVNKTSPNSSTAWQVIRATQEREGLRLYSKLTGKVTVGQVDPANSSVSSSSDLSTLDLFAAQIPTSHTVYQPEWQTVTKILQDMARGKLVSQQSASTAVDTAAEALKQLL